jgi:hypothetical protein
MDESLGFNSSASLDQPPKWFETFQPLVHPFVVARHGREQKIREIDRAVSLTTLFSQALSQWPLDHQEPWDSAEGMMNWPGQGTEITKPFNDVPAQLSGQRRPNMFRLY